MPRWASGATGLPPYWREAKRDLASADAVMAGLTARYGPEGLVGQGNAFVTLTRSIIGQQISVRAAESIWQRLEQRVGAVSPVAVAGHSEASLRAAGLTRQKAGYLRDLAIAFEDGSVGPTLWGDARDDETIIAAMRGVRGIGRWTAEMFLIFHLMRPDVLPLGDIGLRRATEQHYADGTRLTTEEIEAHAERWRPWRSVATWYLWRSLDPLPVAY